MWICRFLCVQVSVIGWKAGKGSLSGNWSPCSHWLVLNLCLLHRKGACALFFVDGLTDKSANDVSTFLFVCVTPVPLKSEVRLAIKREMVGAGGVHCRMAIGCGLLIACYAMPHYGLSCYEGRHFCYVCPSSTLTESEVFHKQENKVVIYCRWK